MAEYEAMEAAGGLVSSSAVDEAVGLGCKMEASCPSCLLDTPLDEADLILYVHRRTQRVGLCTRG